MKRDMRSAALAVAVAVVPVLVAACGGSSGPKTVNTTKAENFLEQNIAKASPGVSGIKVTCPSGVKSVPGTKFYCHATDNNGANTCVGYVIDSNASKMTVLPQNSETEAACFKSHGGWVRDKKVGVG